MTTLKADIQELDTVTLRHDLPEHNLKQGTLGAVVHSYTDGQAFEVEFVSEDGNTLALVTLSPSDIQRKIQPPKLFFSYAHKDETLRDELATHLSLLKRQGIIDTWHDRNITAGTDWVQAIDDNLDSANIILLLISADFLASDYCYDKEMTRALEHHNQSTARVIPIILRPCDWHSAPFGKLQALPKDAKPVTQWSNQEEAFTNIVQGIRKAVTELQYRKSSPITPTSKTASPQSGNVTMNFYGTVHGAAGTVQGDQSIHQAE